tara:strand:- start:315 stop:590 length:276 start_codon:yes stop_codon:yes gene_type:complete
MEGAVGRLLMWLQSGQAQGAMERGWEGSGGSFRAFQQVGVLQVDGPKEGDLQGGILEADLWALQPEQPGDSAIVRGLLQSHLGKLPQKQFH